MTNPLLEPLREKNLLETVTVALPTLGCFYEEGVLAPDADPTDIEVLPVGIIAELHVRDPFLLASGKGMDALIRQICPSIIDPGSVCEVDIEAILIASRIVSHGPEFVFVHECEQVNDKGKVCGEENKISINLHDLISKYEPFDFSDRFVLEFPDLGQKVLIRPLEYRAAIKLLKSTLFAQNDYAKFEETPVVKMLKDEATIEEYARIVTETTISNIEGILSGILYVEQGEAKVYDKDSIKEWILRLPEGYVKQILKKQEELAMWLREKTKVTYNCSVCGGENQTHIEMDVSKLFFSEPRGTSHTTKSESTSRTKKRTKQPQSRTSPRSQKRTAEQSTTTN